MIKPYFSNTLSPAMSADPDQIAFLGAEAAKLPKMQLQSMAAANLVMMGSGYFSPLRRFMNQNESVAVASSMRCRDGMFWPVPLMNLTEVPPDAGIRRLALLDPNHEEHPVMAVQDVDSVEEVADSFLEKIAKDVFGTDSTEHPGVERLYAQGRFLISGPIEVLSHSYYPDDFPDTFRTAAQIRAQIAKNGWRKVVAFQTRNPMHRAHEELCKIALDELKADGLVIHMLLGKLKAGDIPASVRDESIRIMVEKYFPANTVLVCGYGFDMLYAGPREALLHAIFRQNMGADHLIVGRDHAGVGKWYDPFAAQEIFDTIPDGTLDISVFKADHTAWSKKLNRIVMMRDAPDHTPEDYILLSGTAVRQTLAEGKPLPPEFSRPEVADVLGKHYRALDNPA
ncbi:MAG: sulfate adenylyltransferase [Proteobacteria bacterium]|nr:sulfate adenylyltransferase [Pseudomonadota bacterium]